MARSGTASAARTLAAPVTAIIQNRTGVPRKGAVARITRFTPAFPKWNSDSLRPDRRAKRAGPTMPREMAASVGVIAVPASAPTTAAAATGQKRGASGITRQVAVTTTTAPASSARLARVASTRRPIGVCDKRPTSPPIESARPMLASSQACWVSRYTPR